MPTAEPAPAPTPAKVSVFCDTDVLIAGSASTSGASRLILQLGELGLLDVVSSAQARKEAERNLAAKLPHAVPAFHVIADAACRWEEDPDPDELGGMKDWAHPKDLPILAAAIRARCSSLVTFNVRDYRPPRGTVRIEKPSSFVRRVRSHLARLSE